MNKYFLIVRDIDRYVPRNILIFQFQSHFQSYFQSYGTYPKRSVWRCSTAHFRAVSCVQKLKITGAAKTQRQSDCGRNLQRELLDPLFVAPRPNRRPPTTLPQRDCDKNLPESPPCARAEISISIELAQQRHWF